MPGVEPCFGVVDVLVSIEFYFWLFFSVRFLFHSCSAFFSLYLFFPPLFLPRLYLSLSCLVSSVSLPLLSVPPLFVQFRRLSTALQCAPPCTAHHFSPALSSLSRVCRGLARNQALLLSLEGAIDSCLPLWAAMLSFHHSSSDRGPTLSRSCRRPVFGAA